MKLKRLYELRDRHNLTQEDISQVVGVSRTTYAMYEQGNREMDYQLLIKIADYFQVSLDYILERTNIPIHPESYTADEIEFMTRSLTLYKEMKSKFR